MNKYDIEQFESVVMATHNLEKAFDNECNNNNEYYYNTRQEFETTEDAVWELSENEDFIHDYLSEEAMALAKVILARHCWFKFTQPCFALQDNPESVKEYNQRVADANAVDKFINNAPTEKLVHGTETILSDENASLKQKIKDLQAEVDRLTELNITLASRIDTVKKVLTFDQSDLEMSD